jgi:DNA-directed RNA polymerase subunit RPC12/RpoP
MSQEKQSASESLVGGRSMGAFRCLQCFKRISPPPAAKTYKCPHCGYEWRVFWISPEIPRIRGPVWDVNRRLSDEAANKEARGGKK